MVLVVQLLIAKTMDTKGPHISNGETNASIFGFTITNGSLSGVKVGYQSPGSYAESGTVILSTTLLLKADRLRGG